MKTLYLTILLLLAQVISAQNIRAPKLSCATRLPNGDVTLTWQLPTNTCGPFQAYDIWHATNRTGPYLLLTSVTNPATTTYTHLGADCNVRDNYYYMTSRFNCPGGTTRYSDTLDCEDPVAPFIEYVSVFNGGVEIHWQPSTSPETFAYIIYRDDNGFNPIDTVFGRQSDFYYDVSAQPGSRNETYTIAAMDSCGNTGPFYNQPHQTILLDTATFNCELRIDMLWTAYKNWTNDSIAEHRIQVSRNGGLPATDTVLSGDLLRYFFSNFSDGEELCLTVAAVDPTGQYVSVSNAICFTVNIVQPAQYLYMSNATVTDSIVFVYYKPDPNGDYVQLEILRSASNSAYSVINVNPPPPVIPNTLIYQDKDPDAFRNDRYYQVRGTDSCGNSITSGYVRTIFVDGIGRPNFTNLVRWNPFEITHGTVAEYHLWRWDPTGSTGQLLTTIPATPDNRIEYVDDISTFAAGDGAFCYRVNATGDLAFPNGVTDSFSSWSNVACISQTAIIHIPTAMVPQGKNNQFKPVISFEQTDTYLMLIFNRWGEKLFETRNIDEGWDGRYNGQIVPQGVYSYFIQVTGANGNIIERKGTFMVIR